MADKRYEILLEPRISRAVSDNKKLMSDLEKLNESLNQHNTLQLSLSTDINKSVRQLTTDLSTISKQMGDQLKITVALDYKQQTKSSGSGYHSRQFTEEEVQIKKLEQSYRELLLIQKQINGLEFKKVKLDILDVKQIAEINNQLDALKNKYSSIHAGITESPFKEQILTQEKIIQLTEEEEKGTSKVNVAKSQQFDLEKKITETKERLGTYLADSSIIQNIVSPFRNANTAVVELNRAMDDFHKVSGTIIDFPSKVDKISKSFKDIGRLAA